MKLPSKFQIGDEVYYEGQDLRGVIVAIRFTKSKVFYDVLDEYDSSIRRQIDSAFVTEPKI